ncbi:hypothetical protein chiPu_0030238 [Chiloscyllium punctatum]|uniref:Uncharacterized protein n=1 Tax=Chiloscyllium punctatum TaxID=137246 RepID=A0A401TTI9_CHIPU|nr:hypothetical protein [Chiloscyllium punctatum]
MSRHSVSGWRLSEGTLLFGGVVRMASHPFLGGWRLREGAGLLRSAHGVTPLSGRAYARARGGVCGYALRHTIGWAAGLGHRCDVTPLAWWMTSEREGVEGRDGSGKHGAQGLRALASTYG